VVDGTAGTRFGGFILCEGEDGSTEHHTIGALAALGAQIRHVPLDRLGRIRHRHVHVVVGIGLGPQAGRQRQGEQQQRAGKQSSCHRNL
jgi:hypothetical protein